MADYTITFGPLLAVDPAQGYQPAQSATGAIYSATDKTLSTKLSVTDVASGNSLGTDITSDSAGFIPKGQVTVTTTDPSDLTLVWVSGNYRVVIESITASIAYLGGRMDTVEDVADNAKTLAQQASSKVDQAVTTTATAIDSHLGGDATGLVNVVAGKADLDPDTGKVKASQLPDTASPPAATNATYGVIKLGGDLAGPASAPVVPGLASKATDTAVVHKTGAETVAGVKTFTSAPVVPDGAFAIAKVSGLQDALDDAGSGGGSSLTLDTDSFSSVL